MEMHVRNANDSVNITTTEAYMLTSEVSLTAEEEDAIVTLVVVVIGIIVAIMVLFSMGIFIDCKHQKTDSVTKKRKLKLKMPLARRNRKDEVKALASDMCPNANDSGFRVRDAIV
ncbi:uncharacterized protein LOC126852053 [Cataglyphis hispanica]|uniref:uncharacterized protein LOC126852053 n=1 Tax=Cataglyphis hispanica TaxID=1086592 RepID=UPI00217FF91F|nr:uncharacterized protein LOC126852053 [Cataglyphis hispanica]